MMTHLRALPDVSGSIGRNDAVAMRPGYREDIDWLRAIAVLAVVAFHFEAPAIFGGFVGVDIFFVISGYLITGIVQAELKAGTFSFARFYERRIRRLLPALYAMVALTAVPTFHYLLASERLEFFRSVAAVATFTSNFFFWWQSGYFDHAAVEKPLLHTWSLAVEEQFYLALPLILWSWVRWRRGQALRLSVVLFTIGVASFGLCIWLMRGQHSSAAFFMSPPRAWEFLLGGLIALPNCPITRFPWVRRMARGLGVLLIAIPAFSLRQGPGFPGVNALAPCLGAMIFIWSGIGVPTRPRSQYSPLGILNFFGRISYSLYLWHWPVFTFARFSKSNLTLEAGEKILLFAATVGISYLSWRFVEQPFRERSTIATRQGAFRLAGIATALLLVASAGGIGASSGPSSMDQIARQLETYDDYPVERLYRSGSCFSTPDGMLGEACLALIPGKINLLLWGDSFAAHYFHGLQVVTNPKSLNVLQATQPTCMPTLSAASQGLSLCRNLATQMEALLRDHKPDVIVLSADWLEDARPPRFAGMIADLRHTLATLDSLGIFVVLLGPPVQYRSRLPAMLLRSALRHVDPLPADFLLEDVFALDERMKAALPAQGKFSYISVLDAVCPQRRCPLTIEGGIPLAWDHAHLTAEGSVYVMSKVVPMLGLGN